MGGELTGAHRDVAYVVPSLGEYPVYDDVLYAAMIADEGRTSAYRRAVERLAPGRSVVDIGTGQDAIWAVTAAKAGATKVYAIEQIPEAAERARAVVRAAGYGDVVEIIEGISTEVTLPQRVDLCVSEIIGTIGGSEGAARVLDDARRRFLAPNGRFVPAVSATSVAAVDLDRVTGGHIRIHPAAVPYVHRIFRLFGGPFDVRMSLLGLDMSALLSTRSEVEWLRFDESSPTSGRDDAELRVTRPGRIHGLGLGVRLWVDSAEAELDSMVRQGSWIPVFAPVSGSGVPVSPGDRVELTFSWSLSDDGVHPDYHVVGTVRRRGGEDVPFEWDSPHHAAPYCGNDFYRSLFAG